MQLTQVLTAGALFTLALASDNYVKLPVTKTKSTKVPKLGHSLGNVTLGKRSDDVDDSLLDDGVGYFATLAVGSPAQTIRVQIDTGSSDLWFPGVSNPQCPEGTATPIDQNSPYQDDFDYCLRSAEYDSSASSSWKADDDVPAFHIEYVDGSFAKGTWGTDNVQWNDVTIDNFFLAAANDSNATSVFGIAMTTDESSNEGSNGFSYPNWPVRLKQDGHIAKVVYSLYPSEDPYTVSGNTIDITLLFGGVDSAKYSGTLAVFPIDSNYDLAISLTGITTSISGETQVASSQTLSAVLDSGTTLQALPYYIVEQLAANLGGNGDVDSYGYYVVPCSYGSDDHLTYHFGDKTITVPVAAVVSQDSANSCALTIQPTTGLTILGDTFLINAYVVYDIEDHEIAIAQAKYTDAEDIQPVISTIPGGVRANDIATATSSGPSGFATSLVSSSSA